MLDLARATRIHNRPEMSHQPLDGHDLLPHLEEGRSSPAKQLSGDRLFMRRPWVSAEPAFIACSANKLPARRTEAPMPIRAEMRWFYPIDWPQLSRHVRFERAGGVCQGCGRPHGEIVRVLPDGRWFDATRQTWRNGRGRPTRWPDIEDAIRMRQTRVILAAAHLDHNPGNNRLRNLRSLCQRCHLVHDRPHHLAQRRITYMLRCALGDLFLGPYPSNRRTTRHSSRF